MYHQAPDMDSDFVRAWTLIHELSEQLAHNQKMISTLASQAGLLQVRATLRPGDQFLCCVTELRPSIRRLRPVSFRRRDLTYADSTQTFPKVCLVLIVYGCMCLAICNALIRWRNRKVRIGTGTCQRSNGHREPRSPPGEPTAQPATERLRTINGECHE